MLGEQRRRTGLGWQRAGSAVTVMAGTTCRMLDEQVAGICHVVGSSSFPGCPTAGDGHFERGSEALWGSEHPSLRGAGARQGTLAASKAATTR